MTTKQLSDLYNGLDDRQKVIMLLRFAHRVTIVARDAYSGGVVRDAQKMMRINEFQHRLIQHALGIIEGSWLRTGSELAEYLIAGFDEIGAASILDDAALLTYL